MSIPRIFDRTLLKHRRNRAASRYHAHDVIPREIAHRLADRLLDIDRRFARALLLGAGNGALARAVEQTGRVEWMAQADLSEALLRQGHGPRFTADDEAIPVAQSSCDLVLCTSLHRVNDVPGALAQIHRILRPDGLFLAAVPGVGTLSELSGVFLEADMAHAGGAGPRVSPFMDVRDAGSLLQRAGFALPVVDVETLDVRYRDLFQLLSDLRGMGEGNALHERARKPLRRDTLAAAAALYATRHGGTDGRIPATLSLLMLAGWAPHDSQQQPAKRGSGQVSLRDVLE